MLCIQLSPIFPEALDGPREAEPRRRDSGGRIVNILLYYR